MRDGILACDYGTILQACRDVMGEVAVDSRNYVHVRWDTRDRTKKVNCGFKTPCKQSRSGEE